MRRNATRADLKEDILMALGAPTIKVNLTDGQLDFIINYAIRKYWRWHYEGSFENYYSYTTTATDITNGYIIMPEYIDTVVQIIPTSMLADQTNFATAQWQMTAANVLAMNRFMPLNLVDYVATQQRVTNTRIIMGEDLKLFEWAKHQRRVLPRFKWAAGDLMMFKVYEVIDPDRTDAAQVQCSLLFDDDVLRDLCVAKAKQQWGAILERFAGATLPGGITLSGDRLLAEGKEEEANWIETIKSQTVDFLIMA